jgi:hypothetical protein
MVDGGGKKSDSDLVSYLDEPSPRGASTACERCFARTLAAGDLSAGRAAMDSLNFNAPTLFPYAPVNVAVVPHQVGGFNIDPYSWPSALPAMWLRQE